MAVKRYALVRNNIVENVIMLNPETEYEAPAGCLLVDADDTSAGVGDTYDSSTFTKPAVVDTSIEMWAELREKRNKLLEETDWWASNDLQMAQDKINYRQALRDLPANSSINTDSILYTMEADWPTKP